MKININTIPFAGLILDEEVAPSSLDLETEIIKFHGPLKVKANISKITNAVTANINLAAVLSIICGRCLKEFEIKLEKNMRLNYPVNKTEPVLDLGPDIREEIILDYPMKPLCSLDCKGLCPKCGKNLNEGKCSCKN